MGSLYGRSLVPLLTDLSCATGVCSRQAARGRSAAAERCAFKTSLQWLTGKERLRQEVDGRNSGSTIARCRSTSGGASRGPVPAPRFRRGDEGRSGKRCGGEWTPLGRPRRMFVREIRQLGLQFGVGLISIFLVAVTCPGARSDELSVTPSKMGRIGTIDERFQSYNVEMGEVTGGRFWRPYGPNTSDAHSDLYAYRPPIDLTNAPVAKAGLSIGARLSARQRHLGERHLVLRIRMFATSAPPADSTEF